MTNVSINGVRDVISISLTDIPDDKNDKVLKMVKRAEVTLELGFRKEVDYGNCLRCHNGWLCCKEAKGNTLGYLQSSLKHVQKSSRHNSSLRSHPFNFTI